MPPNIASFYFIEWLRDQISLVAYHRGMKAQCIADVFTRRDLLELASAVLHRSITVEEVARS